MGGPGSFQSRFEEGLLTRGWVIRHGLNSGGALPDIVVVVGGTRQLARLYQLKRRGVSILYRLDGLLWLHRLNGFRSSPAHWIGSELRNGLAQCLHGRMADCVIYQSKFVEQWWRSHGWWQPTESLVVSNGLDLKAFRPGDAGASLPPDVVCVEGHIDYSPYAIELLNFVADGLASQGARLILYGGFGGRARKEHLDARIDYRGAVSREDIPPVYRHRVYMSLDVNPACPNAVAEALASGSPVIGFDTGAVKELVGEKAGCIVPFGGDPWKGDSPDFPALLKAYAQVAGDFEGYSRAARRRAEEHYDIDQMVDSYIAVIERTIARCRA
jgi:glycosyltransferase involved in cell wall biosynthesis